jgi:LPS export ABC transporter permease LptG
MFTAGSMTKGHMIPAWLAMWLPNILLGAAGVGLLAARARSADQPIRISLPPVQLPARLRRWWQGAAAGATSSESLPASAQAPTRREPVVLVIRIPQFQLPRPRLLDLYVARLYVRILAITALGMAGLFYLSTFIDLSDKWFKGDVTLGMLLQYLWWASPQFFYYVLALAVLLSGLVTIGLLTKNSELVVMRACGVSLYRTAVPLLVFAACAGGLLFALQERVLPWSNRRAEQLRHVIRGFSPQTFDVLNRKWVVGAGGEIYHYQFFDPRRRQLNGLSVFEFDTETHRISRRLFASQASYDAAASARAPEPVWLMQNGWIREFSPKIEVSRYTPLTEARLPLEAADYFVTEVPEPDRMNFEQLRRYIAELRASGYHVLEHEVALQRKLAFPFVTMIMTLIAVPFAVTTGRRGAMYGIGVGIVLALVYWTMISVFAAIGAAGLIQPALAAWAPNLLFGAAAVYLLLTVRT